MTNVDAIALAGFSFCAGAFFFAVVCYIAISFYKSEIKR